MKAPNCTGVIDIIPFDAGDPSTDAYQDGLALDEDPDVEALGAIDAELSDIDADTGADPADPPSGDRPWETYVKTDADLEADAFFASVEQSADARLRGKAIAVGGEKRGIIASASYEARKMGVYTPMPTVRARQL